MIERFPHPMESKPGFCDFCNEEKPEVYTIRSYSVVIRICKDCLEEPEELEYDKVPQIHNTLSCQTINYNIGGEYERKL